MGIGDWGLGVWGCGGWGGGGAARPPKPNTHTTTPNPTPKKNFIINKK